MSGRKFTTEEFINNLNNINPNIKVIGDYIGSTKKIKCKCKIDGYIWEPTSRNLLRGHGCPKCAKCNHKTTNEFKIELAETHPTLNVLGEYINNHTPIKVECRKCGYVFETKPMTLTNNRKHYESQGCPNCARKCITTESFKNEIRTISPSIEILGEYVKNSEPMLLKCKICNYEFYNTPRNLRQGSGCPKCNASRGEKAIMRFLDKLCIEYEYIKKFNTLIGVNGRKLSYDFYIPYKNLLIEYQGYYHFKNNTQSVNAYNTQIEHDKLKREFAIKNRLELLEISYKEINNIENILKEKLFEMDCKTNNNIYKCFNAYEILSNPHIDNKTIEGICIYFKNAFNKKINKIDAIKWINIDIYEILEYSKRIGFVSNIYSLINSGVLNKYQENIYKHVIVNYKSNQCIFYKSEKKPEEIICRYFIDHEDVGSFLGENYCRSLNKSEKNIDICFGKAWKI